MSSPIRITGLDALNATLKKLPPTIKGPVLRQALRKGAQLILRDAKSRVPKGTGGLKRALTTIVKEDKSGNIYVTIGANMPDGAHAHLVEFGTKERFVNFASGRSGAISIGGGGSRGSMPTQPFLRPAFDSQRDAVMGVIAAELDRAIAKAAR